MNHCFKLLLILIMLTSTTSQAAVIAAVAEAVAKGGCGAGKRAEDLSLDARALTMEDLAMFKPADGVDPKEVIVPAGTWVGAGISETTLNFVEAVFFRHSRNIPFNPTASVLSNVIALYEAIQGGLTHDAVIFAALAALGTKSAGKAVAASAKPTEMIPFSLNSFFQKLPILAERPDISKTIDSKPIFTVDPIKAKMDEWAAAGAIFLNTKAGVVANLMAMCNAAELVLDHDAKAFASYNAARTPARATGVIDTAPSLKPAALDTSGDYKAALRGVAAARQSASATAAADASAGGTTGAERRA